MTWLLSSKGCGTGGLVTGALRVMGGDHTNQGEGIRPALPGGLPESLKQEDRDSAASQRGQK